MKKNLYFWIFPVILIILLGIIFVFDKKPERTEEEVTATTQAAMETTPVESKAPANMVTMLADFDGYGLQEDAVPDVKSIIEKYHDAKIHGDANAMLEIYGKTEEDASLTSSLESDKRLYQRFEDTKTFVTNGVEKDTYLVFVTSKIKFYLVDTLAPNLTWTYVKKTEDGKIILKDPFNLTPEENAFFNKVASTDAVKKMNDKVKKELAAAVISDAKLASIYKTLSTSNVTGNENTSAEAVEGPSDAQVSIIGENNSGLGEESTTTTEEARISINVPTQATTGN